MSNTDTNTKNPINVVIHPTPKQGVYSRDDFVSDLAKVSSKTEPQKPDEGKS